MITLLALAAPHTRYLLIELLNVGTHNPVGLHSLYVYLAPGYKRQSFLLSETWRS